MESLKYTASVYLDVRVQESKVNWVVEGGELPLPPNNSST
jgi:hypothetical protein